MARMKGYTQFVPLACLLAVILVTPVNAAGQAGRGKVSGLVMDPSGSVIPGATVKLEYAATGVSFSTVTSGSGLYSFVSLDPGTYKLTVQSQGFETVVHTNVPVEVDHTTTLNITLQPGAVRQEVTVTAAPPLTETTSSTVGQLINETIIQRVPLVDRDVFKLVQLSPGIIPVNGAVNNVDFNDRPGAEVSGFTINGQPQGTLFYLLDGSPLTIPENNIGATIPGMLPPLDSVQEYRVETNNVLPSYQSAGTGVISLVSKSGSNKLHGDGFYYARPNFWAANDPFVKASQLAAGEPNRAPNFHRYQWGGSVGGPIRRDKTFFFADYEGTTQRSLDTRTTTVPTQAERTGDFSADGFTIYNPFDVVSGQRQPFSYSGVANVIPPSMLNAVALAYAKEYPNPNRAGTGPYHLNNYFDGGLAPDDEQKLDARIDDNVSDKQRLFGRFSLARLKFGNANHFHNAFDPNNFQNITNDRNFLLADDYSLTPTTLLEFRYSFTRHFENQTATPAGQGFDMTTLGFPSSLMSQVVWKQVPMVYLSDAGAPDGTSNIGSSPWTTFHFATQQHDFIVALNSVKGRHTLKTGFEFTKQYMNVGQPIAPEGFYMFDSTATSSATWNFDGSGFADFLLGMGSPNEWQNAFTKDAFVAEANPYYGSFIQDEYRVTSKLTLNLGLRWDIFGGRTERHNRLEWFDPNLAYTVNGVRLTGGEQFVKNGGSPFATNMKDFGPRFGLAYQPTRNLVVRGGFGIFYGPSTHMVANSNINSDSFYPSTFWSAVSFDAAGNSIRNNPLNNPFPSGVVQGTNGRLGPATNLGATLTTVFHSQPEATAYDYNFGVEYELPRNFVASIGWVGSRGLHLHQTNSLDLNTLRLAEIKQYNTALNNTVPNPYVNAITDPTAPLFGATTLTQCQALDSFPQFSNGVTPCGGGVAINGIAIGDSSYHSMQAKLEKRLTAHFTTLASFTWSKLLSDVEGPLSFIGQHAATTFQDWRDRQFERSVSSQDIPWWFSWQMSYDLPIGKGRALNTETRVADAVVGGWTVNSVLSFGGGVPIIVNNVTLSPYFGQRPNLVCNPAQGAPHTAAQWFLPTCFAMPASEFIPGTAPRTLSSVRADGTHNWDASLVKNFKITESKVLQVQLAAFNVTNSVQLGIPNSTWNPSDLSSFGVITNAASQPRQFQFGARFRF